MVHFDVYGRDADRELLRALAQRLANDDAGAARLRSEVRRTIALVATPATPPSQPIAPSPQPATAPKSRRILAGLRRSPLVGADLDFTRGYAAGRGVEV